MLKKVLIFFFTTLLCCSSIFSAVSETEKVLFTAKPTQVDSNYEFEIDIYVDNLSKDGIGGVNLSLYYDNLIFKVDDVATDLDGAVVKLRESENRVNFAWENISGELKNGDKLFSVKFSCNNKPSGLKYKMSLRCLEIYDATENLGDVEYETKVESVNFSSIKVVSSKNVLSTKQIIIYACLFLLLVALFVLVYILILNKKISRGILPRLKKRKRKGKNYD